MTNGRGRWLGAVVACVMACVGCGAAPAKTAAIPPTPSVVVGDHALDPMEHVDADVALVAAAAPLASTPVDAAPRTLASCMADHGGSLLVDRSDARREKVAALTFDDGPHVTYTPPVLDLLAAHHRKATFFVVGRAINSHTYGLIQRTIAEGHTVGSHSYDHNVEMASEYGGEQGVAYVVGEHVTTQALVDLAVVATSAEDFDALYERVFRVRPFAWISKESLRAEHEAFAARTREVLGERGVEGHAYAIGFYRPPGGGTYLGSQDTPAAKRYEEALDRLGLVNVLWHGATGETEAGHTHDAGYQQSNMAFATRRGGVVLIHDSIDKSALARGLEQMDADGITVVSLEEIAREKLDCR